MNIDSKVQQNTSKLNETHYIQYSILKSIIHHDQIGFIEWMQRYFNSFESISVIHHTNTLKNKRHMIISADDKKSLIKFNIYL